MKKTVLVVALSGIGFLARAQRFFYVESKDLAARILRQDLLHEAQFVSGSAVMSDYIVKTAVDFSPNPQTASLQIIVQDSVSFKPVFQAKEDYHFANASVNQQILLDLAVQTFVKRNIPQIIFSATREHQEKLMGSDF
jgi:hypothetical protein